MNIKSLTSLFFSLAFFFIFYSTLTGEIQKIIVFQGVDNEMVFASLAFLMGFLGLAGTFSYYESRKK
jgi:hypothetical protein